MLDGNGNIVTDAAGTESHYEYDSMDQLTKISMHRVDKTHKVDEWQNTLYTYGYRGLVKTEVNAKGDGKYFVYDKNGNLISKTDEDGTTTFERDLLNRLTKVTDHNGRVTGYGWDAEGNLLTEMQYNHGQSGQSGNGNGKGNGNNSSDTTALYALFDAVSGIESSTPTENTLDVSVLLPETGLTESAAQETQEPSWKELADKLDTTVLDSQTDIGTEEGNETSFLPDVELPEARIPSASAELELIDIPDAEAPTVEAEAPSTGTLSAQTADIPTAQTADTTDDSDDENGNGSNNSSSGNQESFELLCIRRKLSVSASVGGATGTAKYCSDRTWTRTVISSTTAGICRPD